MVKIPSIESRYLKFLLALPVEIVFVTGLSLVGLRNSPEGEFDKNSTSTVSVDGFEEPDTSCNCMVIVPEISPGLTVLGSVVNESWETTAKTKIGDTSRTSMRRMIPLNVRLNIGDDAEANRNENKKREKKPKECFVKVAHTVIV